MLQIAPLNEKLHMFCCLFRTQPFLWRCFPAAEDVEHWGNQAAMFQF